MRHYVLFRVNLMAEDYHDNTESVIILTYGLVDVFKQVNIIPVSRISMNNSCGSWGVFTFMESDYE